MVVSKGIGMRDIPDRTQECKRSSLAEDAGASAEDSASLDGSVLSAPSAETAVHGAVLDNPGIVEASQEAVYVDAPVAASPPRAAQPHPMSSVGDRRSFSWEKPAAPRSNGLRHGRTNSWVLPIGDDSMCRKNSQSGRSERGIRTSMLPIGDLVPSGRAGDDKTSEKDEVSTRFSVDSGSSAMMTPNENLEDHLDGSSVKIASPPPAARQGSETSLGLSRKPFGWFRPQQSYSRPVSPIKGSGTESRSARMHWDFIIRRINANRESRASTGRVAEESQSGLRELQQNFAEISRASAKYESVDWEFWTQVVQDYAEVAKTQPTKLKAAIQNGFPPGLRSLLWQVISSSKSPALEQVYSGLVSEESAHEKAIIKDLDRTSMVKQVDSDSLFRLLKAYSLFDPEVGYTQGMAFIAVPLLLNLNEYEAFCLFVQLMKGYDLRSLFLPGMPGLHLRLYQFERMIEDNLEIVHLHLKRQGVLSSMYASQWFLTVFAYKFPLALVQRIFDIVIAEGYEAILRFAFVLMQKNVSQILEMEFDMLLPFLKDNVFDSYFERPNELVHDAAAVELTPSVLAKYELEYQEINRIEKERNEQMETLRTSNAKLTFQLRQLETSLADLNQEHIEIANKMVSTGLENAKLLHENEHLHEELRLYKAASEDKQDIRDLIREKEELSEVRKRLEGQVAGLQDALMSAVSENSA